MKEPNERKQALIVALNITVDEAADIEQDAKDHFTIDGAEYLVLTEQEADDKAKEEIERSLWAFNADFILNHNSNSQNMDCYEYEAALKALKDAQGKSCENLNGLMRCLIDDFDEFVEDAIMADGRGPFISTYDGREEEVRIGDTWYYIYRTN